MSENFNVIAIFPMFGQFGATWNPDSGCIVCKTCIFINSNLCNLNSNPSNLILRKRKTELKNLKHSSHTVALGKGIIFAKKRCFFSDKMLTSANLRGPLY